MPLQIRRGTDAERLAMTVPLAQGELLYVTDDQRLYIGNGASLGGVQITGYTDENAQDAAASMLTSGVHSGITFTYGTIQDAAGRIDATVDLSTYSGAITGDLTGSVYATDATLLVDGTNKTIKLDGTVNTDIVPDSDGAYDLGTDSLKFNNLYLGGTTIKLGTATITSAGGAINIPAGSTIGGIPFGAGGSDVSGNIIGDDSTVIVNTATKTITAAGGFIGNLTGNTTGYHTGDVKGTIVADDSTILVDGISAKITGTVAGDINTFGKSFAVIGPDAGIEFSPMGGENIAMYGSNSDGSVLNMETVGINYSRGTVQSPVNTEAGDFLGGMTIRGYRDTDPSIWTGAVAFIANWDASADFNGDAPAAQLNILVGGNGSQKVLNFNHLGVLTVPTVMVADGDATNPSIAFSTDASQDTGFFHPGDGIIAVSLNGTEKIRMDNGGMRVSGFMKVGQVNGTLPSPPEEGMIVLDGTTFKGYTSGGWVNLN